MSTSRTSDKPPLSRKSSQGFYSSRRQTPGSGKSTPSTSRAIIDQHVRNTKNRKIRELVEGGVSARKGFSYKDQFQKHNNPLCQIKNVFGEQKSSIHSHKANLCISALTNGCIDSFSEIFSLSHRKPVMIDPITEKYFDIPDEKLKMMNNMFMEAEENRRQGDYNRVYRIFKKIADFFMEEGDVKTALYYHEKGQTIAKESSDVLLESKAHGNMGKVYFQLGQYEEAMKCHEAQLSLVNTSGDDMESAQTEARSKLVDLYIHMAKNSLTEGKKSQSAKYLERAYRTAKQSNDKQLMATTSKHIGEIYSNIGGHDDIAIKYETHYLQLCEETDDLEGIAEAQAHLGSLLQRSGHIKEALSMFKRFIRTAEKTGNIKLVGQACELTGTALNDMERYEEAIPFFERNFQLAQAVDEIDWINRARIKLGETRGDASKEKFLRLIQSQTFDDQKKILEWKDCRKTFESPKLYQQPRLEYSDEDFDEEKDVLRQDYSESESETHGEDVKNGEVQIEEEPVQLLENQTNLSHHEDKLSDDEDDIVSNHEDDIASNHEDDEKLSDQDEKLSDQDDLESDHGDDLVSDHGDDLVSDQEDVQEDDLVSDHASNQGEDNLSNQGEDNLSNQGEDNLSNQEDDDTVQLSENNQPSDDENNDKDSSHHSDESEELHSSNDDTE